ncbi:unnamed protein product, partial [marine sediment metagenome]
GSLSKHKVCLIETSDKPHLRGHELDRFMWWDMKESISTYEHVRGILSAYHHRGPHQKGV